MAVIYYDVDDSGTLPWALRKGGTCVVLYLKKLHVLLFKLFFHSGSVLKSFSYQEFKFPSNTRSHQTHVRSFDVPDLHITMQPFHLTATGYNLNYLPEYIALRHGFFKEQGLDVTVNIPTPWDGVLDALADGTADMCLGGIWVPTMYRERVQNYTVFAQIANRCPLALIGRDARQNFKLSDIAGKTVLMKSGGGASVGLFFKMLLRENGVDPRSVDYIQDLDGVMLGNLFQGGMGDFFVTDNLSALAMTASNPEVKIQMEMVTQAKFK